MSSVKLLVSQKITDLLQKACIDDIPEDEPTRVEVIIRRKSTGNPRLGLVIMYFDPLLQEGHMDKTMGSPKGMQSDGLDYPAREVGGNIYERITGSVEVIANLSKTKEDVETADQIIQEVLARVKWALRMGRNQLMGLKDSYGESVTDFTVTGTGEYDSGGGTANTTRFFVRWTAVTRAKTSV